MSFFAPPRDLRPELLDLDQHPYAEVEDSLNDVRRVNKYLSGYRVLLRHAADFLRAHRGPRPFMVLDAATGSADQPIALVSLARQWRVPIRVVAIDINRKMLDCARVSAAAWPEVRFAQCDILSLPFRENSFDLAINSLSLHHFDEARAIAIVRALHRLGRQGFVVNDLHRSRVAYGAIWILTRLLTRNHLTRHDAPVSVMNAFTPVEMRELARAAGVMDFRVFRHFPYRLALVGRKG